jgi:hypothetical protein
MSTGAGQTPPNEGDDHDRDELLELLQDCDGDVEVRIMSQEGWPLENAIAGIAVRADFTGDECDLRPAQYGAGRLLRSSSRDG